MFGERVATPVVEFIGQIPPITTTNPDINQINNSLPILNLSKTTPLTVSLPAPVTTKSVKSWNDLFTTPPPPPLSPFPLHQQRPLNNPSISPASSKGPMGQKFPEKIPQITSPKVVDLTWNSLQGGNPLKPAGFPNYGNMCFLNAVLQILIHCQPLANMFSKLREALDLINIGKAPFLKAMSEIYSLHEPISQHDLNILPFKKSPIISLDNFYDCLKRKGDESTSGGGCFQGANQEDAQEFLTFLLDQLHGELLANQTFLKCKFNQDLVGKQNFERGDNDDDGEWFQVDRNQRVSLSRTVEHERSAISQIFFGKYRSIVKRPKAKDSITTEPFHCASLEIQSSSIKSVKDALDSLSLPEFIERKISKTLTIKDYPPILILQLKRFVYNSESGVEKLQKFVEYPKNLVPSKGKGGRGEWKDDSAPPNYQLFAVLYHHGRTANGGHYTCHVRKMINDNEMWLYFDDESYTLDTLEQTLAEKGPHCNAYLLFYIQGGGGEKVFN